MTNRVDIATDSDAASAAVVVCRLVTIPLLSPDNLTAPCSRCSRMLQYRPNVPPGPKKLCDDCAVPLMEAAAARNNLRVLIAPKTAEELRRLKQSRGRS